MKLRRSLLETVQGLLERTYAIPQGLIRAERFVIGDRGFAALYGGSEDEAVGEADGQGSRVLVRQDGPELRAAVYFPDAMIRRLEAFPPTAGIGEENVDAFAAFVEEIDHLLTLADRAAAGRRVSRFELELQANVSKWLVLSRFAAGRRLRLDDRDRLWLRWHLFRKQRWSDREPAIRARYRDASRFAVRFLDGWSRSGPAVRRIALLRAFHTAPVDRKLVMIERLTA